MKLIKLTNRFTGINVYVDFDKVTDIIECGIGTVLQCGEQSITVKESRKQIDKLVKQEKGELNMDYNFFNFFDYVENDTICIESFVIATSVVRESDTWVGENKIYQICGVVNECDEICLMFDDLDRLIEASREIYARESEADVFIKVINDKTLANSVDEFLELIKQAEEI
ncbi:hypothetical protein [Enterococcus cecorum]|uniref:hypothetical protein n=1 Tax=Enterococcus cecorum TaxID=44008 RepID=UPI00069CB7D7|nr:hypothetical protein [Enterococcus cecorum]